jgi:hypothetical protein
MSQKRRKPTAKAGVYTIKVSVITEGISHGSILSFEGFVKNV